MTQPPPATVLIIDDELIARNTVELLLKREHYQVIHAENGQQGFEKAVAALPDVILCDVMMPVMDGCETCQRLKADARTAHIPVLLVTALSDRKERLHGIEAGANDYLTKPIDGQDLRLRVRNAIAVKQLYDRLQHSYERLKELEKLRDNLTHMVVHDMRSLVAGVLANMQLLQRTIGNKLDEKGADFIAKGQRNLNSIVEMINSLLDVNRLEAGEMPLQRDPVNLGELAQSAVAPLTALLEARTLTFTAPPEPVTAWCDIDLMRRVINNLVVNAIKFTDPNGTIELIISRQEGQPRLAVRDNGMGIPPEFQQRIFEKFSQVGKGAPKKGTGLGLTFCRLVVEAHGGIIGVESHVNHGSTFWFTLPEPSPVS